MKEYTFTKIFSTVPTGVLIACRRSDARAGCCFLRVTRDRDGSVLRQWFNQKQELVSTVHYAKEELKGADLTGVFI